MTQVYDPTNCHSARGGPVKADRCPADVRKGTGWHRYSYQCSRPRGKGTEGWCAVHDPKAREARQLQSAEDWKARQESKRRQEIEHALSRATVEQLKAEIRRRKT